MDWTERIHGSTSALADLVGAGDPDAPVPTCPDWSLRDLGWHLLEVQSFWTWIIENRPDGPDEYTQGTRPGDDALPDAIRATCAGLLRSLEAADPLEAAWSWSDDHTVGFTLRRQAHESFVHLADAALTVGAELPVADTEFAVDGIDEFLSLNIAASIPEWATFEPDERSISLAPTDAVARWHLRFGRFRGTSPSNTDYDELYTQPMVEPSATTIRADASTLDLWLWGRAGFEMVEIEGREGYAIRLRQVATSGSQ